MKDVTRRVFPWRNDSRKEEDGGEERVRGVTLKIHSHALLPDSRTMRRYRYGGGKERGGTEEIESNESESESKMQWLNDSSL